MSDFILGLVSGILATIFGTYLFEWYRAHKRSQELRRLLRKEIGGIHVTRMFLELDHFLPQWRENRLPSTTTGEKLATPYRNSVGSDIWNMLDPLEVAQVVEYYDLVDRINTWMDKGPVQVKLYLESLANAMGWGVGTYLVLGGRKTDIGVWSSVSKVMKDYDKNLESKIRRVESYLFPRKFGFRMAVVLFSLTFVQVAVRMLGNQFDWISLFVWWDRFVTPWWWPAVVTGGLAVASYLWSYGASKYLRDMALKP